MNTAELTDLLKKTKPIWSTTGTIPHNEWVFFSGDMFYTFNGYHFYSQPFNGPVGAFPASSLLQILNRSGKEIVLEGGEDSSSVKGKTKAEFDYPFNLREHVRSFYIEEGEFLLSRNFNNALLACSQTIFRDNIQYSNCYVVNNRMYSTDGYRITIVETESPNCSIPINTEKMLFDEVRGIASNSRFVSFKLGDGILSAMRNIGHENSVLKHVPQCEFDVRIEWGNPEEAQEILTMMERFDIDFKKKDITVLVDITGSQATLSMNGIKASVQESTVCKSNKNVSFSIHPHHLRNLLNVADIHYLSTQPESDLVAKGGTMVATDGKTHQYLWVEL